MAIKKLVFRLCARIISLSLRAFAKWHRLLQNPSSVVWYTLREHLWFWDSPKQGGIIIFHLSQDKWLLNLFLLNDQHHTKVFLWQGGWESKSLLSCHKDSYFAHTCMNTFVQKPVFFSTTPPWRRRRRLLRGKHRRNIFPTCLRIHHHWCYLEESTQAHLWELVISLPLFLRERRVNFCESLETVYRVKFKATAARAGREVWT